MDIKLKERLAKILGNEVFQNTPISPVRYASSGEELDLKTDCALFKRFLVELTDNGYHLRFKLTPDYEKSYYLLGVSRRAYDTPEEAVYTAYCEMKEVNHE